MGRIAKIQEDHPSTRCFVRMMVQRRLVNVLLAGVLMVSLMGCPSGSRNPVDSNQMQGSDMNVVQITVSIDDAHVDRIHEVADRLKDSGMDVEQTMQIVGVVTGSIEADKMSSLYSVEGVQNVEIEREYQLSPPESDIQ